MGQLKIFPSAGHNTSQPGATAIDGRTEAAMTLDFQKGLVEELKKLNAEYILDDPKESNSQYQSRIKTGAGSVVCDIHFNASSDQKVSGTEVFVKEGASQLSYQMAREIANMTARVMQIQNRGVKTESKSQHRRIGILHKPGTSVVLWEICFITNKEDLQKYDLYKCVLQKELAKILKRYDDMV